VATDNASLLAFFRKRILAEGDRGRIKTLIAQLGDDSFEVREKASGELIAFGAMAEPMLRQATTNQDVEVVRRAEDCLRLIKRGMGAGVPAAAARFLARRKPAGVAEVLLKYLAFAESENVADEVRAALTAVAVREGKVDPVLIAGLENKDPVRRAASAEALARGGASDQIPAVAKLLRDPEPMVRLRVALALAGLKQVDAVAALIDLLGQLPPEKAWPAEDVLLRLAGEQAPAAALGTDEATRRQCRQAWQEWWTAHRAQVDLARLEGPAPTLGYTMLLLLDAGLALEVDAKGKVHWQVEHLEFPLDVQYLRAHRILAAEHGANRVTERNLKGEVVWEKKIIEPLVAQRLPNGNTFIATKSTFVEVDPSGKDVFSLSPPTGEEIMKAAKLPNGDIACVMLGRFVRMDMSGKELQTFGVDVRTAGGKIDVMPNDHVLVPEKAKKRVVEYDTEGRVVWEAEIEEPIAAVHLANGNVLVTTMNDNHAVELDRTGKVVWEYKSDTRVNRAFRR
jgi:hypothetical protein